MRFLIDMNLSPQWVSYLATHGFEAVHWSTVGQAAAADSEIFDFASTNGWIVFTHDLDFGMLLAALRTSAPSVIQVRSQDVLPSESAIRCFERFAQLSRTSKLAPLLLWIPLAIVFGFCRSEDQAVG